MKSDRQVSSARLATYLRKHRPILAVLSLLAVVAVPVLLAVAGGTESTPPRPAPRTVLASATSPASEASVTVTAPTPRNVAETTVPTTVPPTTEAPTTEAPTTEAPTTAAPTTAAPTTMPVTEPPTTQPPTTQPPTTQPPTTEPPTTQPPTTQPPAPVTEPAPAPAPARSTGNTMTVAATGYCGGGTTASGQGAHEGGVAMNAAPLGSTWRVVSSGATYTVNDRIGHGSDFDIYFSDCGAANAFGRQTLTIEQVG